MERIKMVRKRYRPHKWVKRMESLKKRSEQWKMRAKSHAEAKMSKKSKKRIVGYEPSGEPIYGT
jgi:hypothetical protein